MEVERRHSRKRDAIRDMLAGTTEHPSAEMLFARLKPLYPDLSLGTVYRNLSLFRETGEAVCVATVAGQERFDARTESHAHFVCDICGRVIDLDAPLPAADALLGLPGEARSCVLTYYGVCHHCK